MTAQTDLNKIKKIVDSTDEHRNRHRRESWDAIKEILGLSEADPDPEPEPVVDPAPAPVAPVAAQAAETSTVTPAGS